MPGVNEPATSYESVDIGWDPKVRDMLQVEYGNNNPLDVAANLIKKNYGVDVRVVNEQYRDSYDDVITTEKPSVGGAPKRVITKQDQKGLQQKADSLNKTGFWN
jgi:hypothetical protein